MVPRLTDEVFGGWYFGYFMCQVMPKDMFSYLDLKYNNLGTHYKQSFQRNFLFYSATMQWMSHCVPHQFCIYVAFRSIGIMQLSADRYYIMNGLQKER